MAETTELIKLLTLQIEEQRRQFTEQLKLQIVRGVKGLILRSMLETK